VRQPSHTSGTQTDLQLLKPFEHQIYRRQTP
jgi:hypothetical protein